MAVWPFGPWGVLLLLALSVGCTRACLLCSADLKEALEEVRLDYIPGHSSGTDRERADSVLRELVETYQRYSII
ncbi:hypothetical protein chiPu_0031667, partial [Chiloscyllium punctatum]|nr:hypothetical protein [Chiloscyllium punctatum]